MPQTTDAAGPPAAESTRPARLPSLAILVYSASVYLIFLSVLTYAVGFFAGFGVPKAIDDGPRGPVAVAVAVDLLLLFLFAAQHTVMARPWFKRLWTRVVPVPAERATFVLAANLVLVLVFLLWRPIDGTVWSLSGPLAGVVWVVYAAGWAVAIRSTFLISHSDLFGLRQAWHHAAQVPYSPPPFTERGMYQRVRHPLMVGFLIIFWAAPTMTVGHLLFAAAATGYILVGITFEEHDLTRSLGVAYTEYRDRVPALVPRLGRRHPSRVSSASQNGGRHES